MVVSVCLLGDMMKQISTEANLSRVYTNHFIRATAVTILDKSGFEARHIITVSGHRNESSIRAYSKTDQTTNRRMSETLTAAGAGNSAPNEEVSPRKSVLQSAFQYEVTSRVSDFQNGEQSVHRRDG